MAIRLAEEKDLPEILELYAHARKFMAENGNPNQWGKNHPPQAVLETDMEKQQLYVCVTEPETGGAAEIYGVFAFIMGEDPTYAQIENGGWKSDTPYGTIHRIAGNGRKKGLFAECMEFCTKKCRHLRIDTHADNAVMQHCIEKSGFCRCGIIYVGDGTPRIAYEYVKCQREVGI